LDTAFSPHRLRLTSNREYLTLHQYRFFWRQRATHSLSAVSRSSRLCAIPKRLRMASSTGKTADSKPIRLQKGKIKALALVPNEALACFRVDRQYKKKPRAKFEAHRRDEVAAVRKRGACLRCRLLKRTVCSPVRLRVTDIYLNPTYYSVTMKILVEDV
jgi:hypothetical protein